MKQVSVNKWIRLSLTVITGLIGVLIGIDWTKYVDPQTGGIIVAAFCAVKAIIDAVAPSSDKATEPTGGTIITHVAVPPSPVEAATVIRSSNQ